MLTRLQIDGFKNLDNVDVKFGFFTCIAGSNGVGKSNLFDAITFLSDLASMPIVQAASRVRGANGQLVDIKNLFVKDVNGKYRPMKFVVEAIVPKEVEDDFDQQGTPAATYLQYSLTLRLADDQSTVFGKDPVYIELERLVAKRKKEAESELGFLGAPTPPGFLTRFTTFPGNRTLPFIETIGEAESVVIRLYGEGKRGAPQKIPARKSPQTVLAGINTNSNLTALAMRREMQSWRLLQLEPSALRAPDEYGSRSVVTANGEHLPATLHRTGAYSDVAAILSDLIPGVEAVKVDNNDVRNLRTLCVTMRGREFTASALSDGTLRFLALAIMASDPDASGLVCMEEPENGIHPLRIPEMVRLVRQLSDVDVANDSWTDLHVIRQVIINTHSPIVVSEINSDELLMADVYYEEKLQKVRFKPIFDTWRGLDAKSCVSRGQVNAYLSGATQSNRPKSVRSFVNESDDDEPVQRSLI